MAIHHAAPGEIVDLMTWADDQPAGQSTAIVKTDAMELIRLVLPAGRRMPDHQVAGPITVLCLQGAVSFEGMGSAQVLRPGQMLHLGPAEPHALSAIDDAVILLTIVF